MRISIVIPAYNRAELSWRNSHTALLAAIEGGANMIDGPLLKVLFSNRVIAAQSNHSGDVLPARLREI